MTPQFLIGRTNGISFTFTPKEESVGTAINVEPGRFSSPGDRESEQEGEEVYEQQQRRRKLMRSLLYVAIGLASVAAVGYVIYSVDDSDNEESCPSGECYVSGYYRSSGTYVEGYCRRC